MKPGYSNLLNSYEGKNVLITGGLGFIGSNLAHRLVELGADVTLLDNLAPLYGGNRFNIQMIRHKVAVVLGDVRDPERVKALLPKTDIIFHLAGQVSHIDSGIIPHEDLDINAKGTLTLLEACRKHAPNAKIMFASSRLVLGKIIQAVITEDHPTNPLSIYGIHKLAAEKYCQLYHHHHGLRSTVLRITNPYGERQQIKHSKYSMPGWFLRLAMENKTISVFGDGSQMRDYVHISDLVNAFLLAAITEETDGQIYNCGYGSAIPFRRMADTVVAAAGSGCVVETPWPAHYEREETGNCEMDTSKLAAVINWKPRITIEQGIQIMHEYYKKNWGHYVTPVTQPRV